MIFKRKAYQQLLNWKNNYADKYSVLLEGPRRVGKSTIAKHFANTEYESSLIIDFASAPKTVLECFDDLSNLNMFFLRLQATTGVSLKEKNSVIVFDEIQMFPKARQAIKYLVQDGRYHYIETGSLISIKKNVKDILIPSEEMKIQIYPLDYEEFLIASENKNLDLYNQLLMLDAPIGQQVNRQLMRNFRLYMAVGGMPQAVNAFIEGQDFTKIDEIKRTIISLYHDDLKKIDVSGRLSAMYNSIPSQLSRGTKRYVISNATGRKKSARDDELIYNLIDSKTVMPAYNTTDPRVSLSTTKNPDSFKLYLSDTGLFVTLMFMDRPVTENDLYAKLLSDKLPANLGYLYENAVAQMIAASGRELYYHTFEKENSTHYYEVDFLISSGSKISAIEVKSSGVGSHESLKEFSKKFSKHLDKSLILSQKDIFTIDNLKNYPIYLAPSLLNNHR